MDSPASLRYDDVSVDGDRPAVGCRNTTSSSLLPPPPPTPVGLLFSFSELTVLILSLSDLLFNWRI
jgi:hypothetical protein